MGDCKPVKIDGTVILRKVQAIRDDNCDGCFYKNIPCKESEDRLEVRAATERGTPVLLACTRDSYIWEVQDADVNEG